MFRSPAEKNNITSRLVDAGLSLKLSESEVSKMVESISNPVRNFPSLKGVEAIEAVQNSLCIRLYHNARYSQCVENITTREKLLQDLRVFEFTASDPTRLFGSTTAVNRPLENKIRRGFMRYIGFVLGSNVLFSQAAEECIPKIRKSLTGVVK